MTKRSETTRSQLLEHPLFTNRHRLLAVPVAPAACQAQEEESATRRLPRLVGYNLGIALVIILSFGLGAVLTQPAFLPALQHWVAQGWGKLLETLFGAQLGSGLAEKSPWLSARLGGIMAYLLLFGSVMLGLLNRLRLLDWLFHRAAIMYLHRFISLAALLFTGLHVAGLLLDSYLQFDITAILLPFSADYRPVWSGLGTLVVYAAVAVGLTAYLARKVGYRVWRGLHYLSFAIFAATLLHGLMAGSDSGASWMQAIYLITGASVSFLTGLRFFSSGWVLTHRSSQAKSQA